MVGAAKPLREPKASVLRGFKSGHSNGILEGITSLIQAAKAKARSHRPIRNLIAMAYLIAAKLKSAAWPFGLLFALLDPRPHLATATPATEYSPFGGKTWEAVATVAGVPVAKPEGQQETARNRRYQFPLAGKAERFPISGPRQVK